jgi:hypothetical protein
MLPVDSDQSMKFAEYLVYADSRSPGPLQPELMLV